MAAKTATPAKSNTAAVVTVLGGVTLVGLGILFFSQSQPIKPGSKVKAVFAFDYSGEGEDVVLQVSLGKSGTIVPFDHIDGLTFFEEVTLTGPDKYSIPIEFMLPLGTKAQRYDAEALIRRPSMGEFNYLVKEVTVNALTVGSA